MQTTNKFNIRPYSSISNMLEIPRNQIIHAIHSCNGNVQGIFYAYYTTLICPFELSVIIHL